MTARRPTRSDQLPPTTDTTAFTTCSADHISGIELDAAGDVGEPQQQERVGANFRA